MKLAIDFVLVASIVILVVLLLVLVRYKRNVIPQKFLIAIFLILFFLQFTSYGIFHQIRWLQFLSLGFEGVLLLIGPLIYLYIQSLNVRKWTGWKASWFHFSPYFLYVLFLTLPILVSAFQKRYVFEYLITVNEYYYIRDYAELLFLAFYLILAMRSFYNMNTSLKNVFSILEYKNIKWLGTFIAGLLGLVVINLVLLSFETFDKSGDLLDFVTVSSFLLFISYLGYFGTGQSQIFVPDYLFESELPDRSLEKRIYITIQEISEVEKRLKSVFESDKLFLDDTLTLHKLASALQTSDKKLSFYLNHHLNTNFYDFVNGYRIDEFKRILQDKTKENLSLLGIAYECGFKSKSSFNRIFKKATGLSPSQYKESI